jgi:hypothetical protein
MMNPSELSSLRMKLRAVNFEYSALLKSQSGEGRFVRMDELKAERRALMARMAGNGVRDASQILHSIPNRPPFDAANAT